MKTLKLMLSVLMLLATFAACKKGNNDPNDPNDPENVQKVSKADLLPYYIVAERKTGDQKLAVMTFTQDGDGVKVNLHRQGYLRSIATDVTDNTLTFDLDGTGTYTYRFALEKNASGQITLKSFLYTDKSNAAQGLDFAVLANTTSAQTYENADFKTGNLLFRFTGSKNIDWDIKERQIGTKYYPPPINQTLPIMAVAPEVSIPYYALATGSFKANSDFIGAVVPSWKNVNSPILVVERNNIIYQANKQ
ncbi:hypothetical protein [Pedobacter psychrodurus]|uniref:hypothetical protein n=1 Tax=Pedobacter psychrodurus TaxID=2530456 RepID=UPI00292D28F5|nr:hypothetical protein [Pedobacter psychrodurus]